MKVEIAQSMRCLVRCMANGNTGAKPCPSGYTFKHNHFRCEQNTGVDKGKQECEAAHSQGCEKIGDYWYAKCKNYPGTRITAPPPARRRP